MKPRTNYLIVFFILFSIGNVFAQSKTVRNVGVGQTYSTIQAAIGAANNGDIINIVDAVHHEDPILIAKDITIQGQGASSTTIEGGYVSSTNHGSTTYNGGIFIVYTGHTVTIQDLTLTKGAAENGTDRSSSDYGMSGGNGAGGGAIRNYNSVLTVKRCVFTENYAGNGGKAGRGQDGADGANATSTSSAEPGGYGGVGGNGGNGGNGGAIFNTLGGTIHIEDCLFTNNYAGQGGVAAYGGKGGRGGNGTGTNAYDDGAYGGDGGNGGAICNDNGTLTIENCTFYSNSAGMFGDGRYGGYGGYGGSGVYSSGYNGNGANGGFGGNGGDYGKSGSGGAIANINNSTVECVNITITDCYSKFDDITSNTVDGGRGGRGGSGNYGGNGGDGGNGGHAPSCGYTGGIYNASTVDIKMINSIVYDDEIQFFSKVGGHGGLGGNRGVGNSSGVDGDQGAAGTGNSAKTSYDVYGSFDSEGYNIVKTRTGSSGWVANDLSSGTNPNLQALANNGGPTQTMAILGTSPANNAGAASNTNLTVPTTDQRGYDRHNSFGYVDIGAYEFVDPESITASPTSLDFGAVEVGSNSVKEYTIVGHYVTNNNVYVSSPLSQYYVSKDNGASYGSYVVIHPTNGEINQTIKVRFKPTSTVTYSTNITNNGSGVCDVSVTGQGVVDPSLSVSPTSLSFGSVAIGSSSTKNYTLTGSNLTHNVTVTAPSSYYKVSLSSGSGFASSVNITPSSGSVNKTIYVKYTPSSTSTNSGNVTNVSSGATTKNVAVSGNGYYEASLSVSPTSLSFGTIDIGTISVKTYVVTGSHLTENVAISVAQPYTLSSTSGGTYSSSLSIPQSGGSVNKTIYVKFTPTSEASPTRYIKNQSSGKVKFVTATGNGQYVPELSVSSTSLAFGNVKVGQSSTKNYTLTGSHLTNNVTVTALTGYQVSLSSGSGFASSVNITPNSGSVNKTIYVKFTPTSSATYNGNITNVSSGATTKNVAVTGRGIQPSLTTSVSELTFGNLMYGATSTIKSFVLTGSDIMGDVTIVDETILSDYGYEISKTSGSGFGTSMTISPDANGDINQTIYVKATANHTGTNVTADPEFYYGSDASVIIDFKYNGRTEITTTPASLDFGNVNVGSSKKMSYTVNCEHLTGVQGNKSLFIYAPTSSNSQYKISKTENGTYGGLIVFAPTGGTVNETIWVKFTPTTTGIITDDVSHQNDYADDNDFSVTGTGVVPTISTTPTTLNFGNVVTGQTAEQSYTLTGSNLTSDITVTAPTGYEVSLTSGSGFASSVVASQTSGSVNTTIYVKFAPISVTTYNGNITNASTDATTKNVAVTGTGVAPATPIITTSLSTIDFGNIQTGTNDVQTYTVEGSDLTDDITISVTGSNFEISEDGTTFGTSNIVLSQTGGTIAQTTIHVRFSPSADGSSTGTISHTSGTATQVNVSLSGNGVTPTISTTPATLSFGNVVTGQTAEQSYTLTGSNLTSDVTVTAPTGYEVSLTSGSGFASSVVASQTSGNVNTPIYVKFAPTSVTTYNGNITNASTDATTKNVAVTGTGVAPATPIITTSLSSINFGNIQTGSNDVQTYNVEGTNLTDDITISVTGSNFEISQDGTTFGTSNIVLSQTGGTVAQTTIHVRFSPSADGNLTGTISQTSGTATQVDISLEGTGVTPTITTNVSSLDFSDVETGQTSVLNYTVEAVNLTDDISISVPSGAYTISDDNINFGTNVTLTQTGGTVSQTTVYVKFAPTSVTSYNVDIANTSTDATTQNVALSGNGVAAGTPVITVSETNLDFGNIAVGSELVKQYNVSGADLTGDITISLQTGSQFTISQDNVTFSADDIVLSQTGGIVNSTIIYVKYAPDATNTFTDVISHTSSGATTRTINLSGDTPTGIFDNEEVELSIYPNPSNGMFNIAGFDNEINVSIYNISGKLVYSRNLNNNINSIDLSNQTSGVYFVKIVSENRIYTSKVVINR